MKVGPAGRAGGTEKAETKKALLSEPVSHLDLTKVFSVAELVEAFSGCSFQSRNLAHCAKIFLEMVRDPEAVIFLGISGALIPGGLRKLIRDLIHLNLVDVLVSTGANVFHDIYEGMGYRHFKGSPEIDDHELDRLDVDRIYDTLVDDDIFAGVAHWLAEEIETLEPRPYSGREFMVRVGERLADENSFVAEAARKEVPLYVPAMTDSAIGMALAKHYAHHRADGTGFTIDFTRDNYEIVQIKQKSSATGAIYLGGGVPKNYIQQIQPMIDVMYGRVEGHRYAVQLTTDDPKWGGLSGCTLEESVSWGKVSQQALMGTAYLDVTIGLPLIAAYVLSHEEDVARRKERVFQWEEDTLVSLRFG